MSGGQADTHSETGLKSPEQLAARALELLSELGVTKATDFQGTEYEAEDLASGECLLSLQATLSFYAFVALEQNQLGLDYKEAGSALTRRAIREAGRPLSSLVAILGFLSAQLRAELGVKVGELAFEAGIFEAITREKAKRRRAKADPVGDHAADREMKWQVDDVLLASALSEMLAGRERGLRDGSWADPARDPFHDLKSDLSEMSAEAAAVFRSRRDALVEKYGDGSIGEDPRADHTLLAEEEFWGLYRPGVSADTVRAAIAEFDSASRSVAGSKGGTREGAITEDEPSETAPSALREEFAGASLGELVEALVPEVPDAALKRLEELIREAQENPPEDRDGFVRMVNRMLDAHSLRLRVDGEQLARLRVLRSSRLGSIQFAIPGGSRGFRKATVEVVRVPEGQPELAARHP